MQFVHRSPYLHAHFYILNTLNRLTVDSQYGFLGLALVTEDVLGCVRRGFEGILVGGSDAYSMSAHENVIALIVQGEDLASLYCAVSVMNGEGEDGHYAPSSGFAGKSVLNRCAVKIPRGVLN
jgi:hypothetical protein